MNRIAFHAEKRPADASVMLHLVTGRLARSPLTSLRVRAPKDPPSSNTSSIEFSLFDDFCFVIVREKLSP